MYNLQATCCYMQVAQHAHDIYLENNDYNETLELLDDAIRGILKPYKKRHHDIGNQTDNIISELLSFTT